MADEAPPINAQTAWPPVQQPEDGKIVADVGVFVADPCDRTTGWGIARTDEQVAMYPHKLRLTIFSGPDFRTASITAGRVFADRATAEAVAEQVRAACKLLCIPICGEPVEDRGSLLRDRSDEGASHQPYERA